MQELPDSLPGVWTRKHFDFVIKVLKFNTCFHLNAINNAWNTEVNIIVLHLFVLHMNSELSILLLENVFLKYVMCQKIND